MRYQAYFMMSKDERTAEELTMLLAEEMDAYANGMLSQVVEMWSKEYEEKGGSIKLQFSPKRGFYANASASKNSNTPIHTVIINYDMRNQLGCDAVSFSRFAAYGLDSPQYRKTLLDQGIPLDGLGLMPKGLTEEYCRNTMLSDGLLWVTKHELAHFLQMHEVPRSGSEPQPWMGPMGIRSGIESPIQRTGKDAEIYHATELAADDDALKRLLIYISVIKKHAHAAGQIPDSVITLADIWVLVCALQCFFMRLHSFRPTDFDGSVEGDHPHPAIRFLLLYRTLVGVLMREDNRQTLKVNFSEGEIGQTINHAYWVTLMYWTARHDGWDVVDSFCKVIADYESAYLKSYYGRIVKRWDEIRPIIAKNYKDGDYFLMVFDKLARRLSEVPVPR